MLRGHKRRIDKIIHPYVLRRRISAIIHMILAVSILLGAPAVPSGESDLTKAKESARTVATKYRVLHLLFRFDVFAFVATTTKYGTSVFSYEVFQVSPSCWAGRCGMPIWRRRGRITTGYAPTL
jgi:hypothetical protein